MIAMKIRQLPYYMIAGCWLICCAAMGSLIVGGAAYIKDSSYDQGQIDIIINMPLESLVHLRVSDSDETLRRDI